MIPSQSTDAQTASSPQRVADPAALRRRLRPRAQRQRAGDDGRRPPGAPRAVAYLYLLPALVVFGIFVLWPLGQTIWYSFYSWSGVGPSRLVGLANYRAVFSDPMLRSGFLHAGILVLFYSVIPIVWGLILATALSRFAVRGLTFFRAVLFLPQVLAMVVVATSWQWLLAYNGPVNAVLRFVGLGGLARPWLGDYDTALPAVGLIGAWVMFGFCMILFLSAIQQIPRSLYEAARVEGAGVVREFFAVTLPGIRNQVAVALTVTVIGALGSFDLVYVLTNGGPGTQTTVPSFLVYEQAFQNGNVGSGAAVAIVLTVTVFLVAVAISRVGES